jgi:hypothetical protein
MNEPSIRLDRQAADIEVEATMTNSTNPDLGRPSLIGRGGRGSLDRRRRVAFVDTGRLEGERGPGCDDILGTISPRMKDAHAATDETPAACTWSSERLPYMILLLVSGSSSWPTFAAVPSRADKFISRFPFKLRMTGMIMTNSSMVLIAFQC